MKKRIAAITTFAAMLITSGVAAAVDLPKAVAVKAPATYLPVTDPFTGFYVGGHIGYGFNTTGTSAFSANDAATLSASPQGFVGGFHTGVGTRFGNNLFYAGIETDIDLANLQGSGSGGLASGLITASSKDDWFGTTRARFGVFLVRDWLIYGTAGVAYGDPSASVTLVDSKGNIGVFGASSTKIGWAAGGGIEGALSDHWLVRAEWLRVDLGNATVANTAYGISLSAPFQADVFRLGASYKF